MATFNAKVFEKKLKDMDLSQTSVQTVSLWIIHHRQNIKEILSVWIEQVKKVKPDRKMVLFYLANDVVQNSRKKAKDLLLFFGKAFREALPYLNDKRINGQVERVFKIWDERRVYDKDFLDKLRALHANGKKEKEKSKAKDERIVKHGDKTGAKSSEKQDEKLAKPKPASRPLPADFKMSAVMNMIVSMKELESEISKQDSQMASLRVDASDLEAVKQVKDRSGVNKFVKQFEESREKLDVYCNTLSRSINDKRSLIDMLHHSETYYEAAYEEAKVIVHAYKTFGSRLASMKRKVESRVRKLESSWKKKQKEIEEKKASQPEYELEPISDADEPNEFQPIGDLLQSGLDSLSKRKKAKDELYRPEDPTLDNVNVLDMDLESDSDMEIPDGPLYDPSSVQYDPNDHDQSQEALNKGEQLSSNLASHIHIPNPEDVFKNLVGQASSNNLAVGEIATSDALPDMSASIMPLENLSGATLQQKNYSKGEQFVMSMPPVILNMANTVDAQQLTESKTLNATTIITSAIPSLTAATEPSRTLIDNSAISPISDDSVPSPEGTPDGLVLETNGSLPATSLNVVNVLQPDPLPAVLHSTTILSSMPVAGTYNAEHIGTISVDSLHSVNAVEQVQHLQTGIADWSVPTGLQSLPPLPSSMPLANLDIGIPFATNNLPTSNNLPSQFIVANDGNLPQPNMPVSVSVSQAFKLDGTEVSTPTQDEALEKSVRPIDILSQLLNRGKKLKDDGDSGTEEEKSVTDHSSKKSRDHSRSSSRRSSSGKRRSSHRHHSSDHKETSYNQTDSSHGSSRSKEKSHSTHRRSRSGSKSKEDVLHAGGSDEETSSTRTDKPEESLQISSKMPRLESIEEINSYEQRSNIIDGRVTDGEQIYGQENMQNVDVFENRQPTIFDMRRNEAQQNISSHSAMNKLSEKGQFSNTDVALGTKNETPEVPVFVTQNSYQETFLKSPTVLDKPASTEGELQGTNIRGTTNPENQNSGYFYNARRSPTPEMDVLDTSRLSQPNFLVDINQQQPHVTEVSISKHSSIIDTIPIPQFALDMRSQLGPSFPGQPIEEQMMLAGNFKTEPTLPPPTIEQHQLSEEHCPPLQQDGTFQSQKQNEHPFMQLKHPFLQSERPPFQPGRAQFPSDQNMFQRGEPVINIDTELRVPQSAEPALTDGSMVAPDTPGLLSNRPQFQNDNYVFRQERPVFQAETPHYTAERPIFRGQRPGLRHPRPPSHFEDGFQHNPMTQHQRLPHTPILGNQGSGNDLEFQANAADTNNPKYNQGYDQNLNYSNDNEKGNFQDDMLSSQYRYDDEQNFLSPDRNIMENDRIMNGPLHVPGISNHRHIRQQRPRHTQHGFRAGDMSYPDDFRARGRFRGPEPGLLRSNRPAGMAGAGNFMLRQRFRPPIRPRLPQAFSPRRPVL